MKASPGSFWKFFLGTNFFKRCQLDFVEKKGDTITVAVRSGKRCCFRIGEFSVKYMRTNQGIRDFMFKSTSGPTQKVVFRETILQMPEEWWDELESKLGVSESAISRVFHKVRETAEDIADTLS